MRDLLILLFHSLVVVARLLGPGSTRGLIAENMLLKQQLLVLSRGRRRAPNLTTVDRLVLGFCTLLVSPKRLAKTAAGVSFSTLKKLHECLVRHKYRALFSTRSVQRKPGPKGPSKEIVRAIVELKRRNRLFGCPRIALIISRTFGIEIDKDVVRRVLAKHYRYGPGGGGRSWLTVIGHSPDRLWSVDLFRCESILLKSHWVMVVMDQYSRRIIGFAVQVGDLDGIAVCRMFNRIVSGQHFPTYLSTDNDPLFRFHRWEANLRVLEIKAVKTVPYAPKSHPFVERLIGTVRRELLDQTMFWDAPDLERKLYSFRDYFNDHRVPSSQGGQTPSEALENRKATCIEITSYRWKSHCSGLFQLPIAA